jgi:hypothetical protein
MAAKPKQKAKRTDQAAPKAEFGVNEDAEYLDIIWGVLRIPVTCVECGKRTRLPYYAGGTKPRCGACYRVELVGQFEPEPAGSAD